MNPQIPSADQLKDVNQRYIQATYAVAVTPDDNNDIPSPDSGGFLIHVGTAGDLKVTTLSGHTAVIPDVPAGIYPLIVKRVWSTGTGASGLVALR